MIDWTQMKRGARISFAMFFLLVSVSLGTFSIPIQESRTLTQILTSSGLSKICLWWLHLKVAVYTLMLSLMSASILHLLRTQQISDHYSCTSLFFRVNVGNRYGQSSAQDAQMERVVELLEKWIHKFTQTPFPEDWVGVQCVDYRPSNRHVNYYTSKQSECFNFHEVTSSDSRDIGGGDHFLDVVDQVKFDEEEESE
mmetsp:Transcript_39115/g.64107  ORF Transcript_39115/g.64107 Transcript_39115/m.64107 type:complete len:197 (+) Transcript_39115:195-785(+)